MLIWQDKSIKTTELSVLDCSVDRCHLYSLLHLRRFISSSFVVNSYVGENALERTKMASMAMFNI